MMLGKKKKREQLNNKTPQWFKDWHGRYFHRVDSRSVRNERLIYILLAAVLAVNTVGNYFHKDIGEFFLRLFGG